MKHGHAAICKNVHGADGAKISGKVVTALYEVLYHPSLLHDEEIMLTLGRAMVHLSTHYEMDITESHERYPGLYCLLTHPEVAVRSLVRFTASSQPSFSYEGCVFHSNFSIIIISWGGVDACRSSPYTTQTVSCEHIACSLA